MRSTARLARLFALALSVIIAFSAPMFLASPSSAASAGSASHTVETARANFGAIAFSPEGAYGRAWEYRTAAKAKAGALKYCKQYASRPGSCRVLVVVKNQCAAAFVKKNRGKLVYSTAIARTAKAAERKANRSFRGSHIASVCAQGKQP